MYDLCARDTWKVSSYSEEYSASQALELYDQASSLIATGAWSCDLASDRLTWTPGVFPIFGVSNEHGPARADIVQMYCEESREILEQRRTHAIESRSGFSLDARIFRADGVERWIRITAATQISNGRAVTLYGMKQDVTDDRARWEALRRRAECDPLTGVANRACFQRFLEQEQDDYSLNCIGALILFDMDGFKQVNDQWGHAAGDACLSVFAKRLRTAFPHARLVSRIGGDEFAILLPPVISRSETEAAIRANIGNLLLPVPWKGDLLELGVSIGLAFVAGEPDQDPQKLFIAADRALYASKRSTTTVITCA